ncbi:hypothetical protein ACFFRR_010406 [Megaselia abdita]
MSGSAILSEMERGKAIQGHGKTEIVWYRFSWILVNEKICVIIKCSFHNNCIASDHDSNWRSGRALCLMISISMLMLLILYHRGNEEGEGRTGSSLQASLDHHITDIIET